MLEVACEKCRIIEDGVKLDLIQKIDHAIKLDYMGEAKLMARLALNIDYDSIEYPLHVQELLQMSSDYYIFVIYFINRRRDVGEINWDGDLLVRLKRLAT